MVTFNHQKCGLKAGFKKVLRVSISGWKENAEEHNGREGQCPCLHAVLLFHLLATCCRCLPRCTLPAESTKKGDPVCFLSQQCLCTHVIIVPHTKNSNEQKFAPTSKKKFQRAKVFCSVSKMHELDVMKNAIRYFNRGTGRVRARKRYLCCQSCDPASK